MDLVERLRMKGPMSFQMDWADRAKAADEIEQLREKSKADEELKDKAAKMIEELRLRNDRLRATLKMITSKTHSTIYEI